MNKISKIIVAIFLAAIFVYLLVSLQGMDFVFHQEVEDYEQIANEMNIRNMVTAIYLGPRMLDTFLEVMVVLLTVFGMKFIRNKP
jgi:multisubunit Na+/H+ antiporter MnhB subunit